MLSPSQVSRFLRKGEQSCRLPSGLRGRLPDDGLPEQDTRACHFIAAPVGKADELSPPREERRRRQRLDCKRLDQGQPTLRSDAVLNTPTAASAHTEM